MVDVRRAYRRWFWRRMFWMLPGLGVSVTVAASLAIRPDLELWLRLPALTISCGVALLFVGLVLLPGFVLAAKARGDQRRAQSLRREARSYPALALAALSVSLILLAVPLLFAPTTASSGPPSLCAQSAGPRSRARSSEMTEVRVTPPEAIASQQPPPAAAPAEPERPPPPPREPAITPPAPAPAQVPADLNPIPPPVPPPPPAPAAVELPTGQELLGLRFRPGPEDDLFSSSASLPLKRLDRAGLPGEDDAEGFPAPELKLELTILPRSRGWSGAIYEGSIDVPLGRNDSFRTGLFVGSLSSEEDQVDLEASVVWQRATLEYERRLAGYTRKSTFDLAVRIGLSVDRMTAHEAPISVASSPRPAPWAGIELALWERDGLGVVVQAGHSFALRVNGAAMSSTDLKIEFRIDVTETFSLELGWHYTAVRIHDQGVSGGVAYQELEQSFSGPVGGMTFRF
jgi:hypothetical protein